VWPAQAITHQQVTAAEAQEAIAESLRNKPMELHEPGVFEVQFEWLAEGRGEVNINYEPLGPPPELPQTFGFGPAIIF
jgi:hypothetical protein